MTTTTHRIRTASKAEFMVAGMNTDGSVFRIGYAYTPEAAAVRVRRHKGEAAFAPITDAGFATFEVERVERVGTVIEPDGRVNREGTVVRFEIRGVA